MKREFQYPSRDGVTQIHAIEWEPEGEIHAVMQLCHKAPCSSQDLG